MGRAGNWPGELCLSEKSLFGPELNRGSGNGEEGTLWRDEKWAEPAGLCA